MKAGHFFPIVIERLGDLFEPRLCETYEAILCTQAIEIVAPGAEAAHSASARCIPRRPASVERSLHAVKNYAGRGRRGHQRVARRRQAPLPAARRFVFAGPRKSCRLV